MRKIVARRPSSGTMLGLLALFVALGGVAFAQGTPGTTTTPAAAPGTGAVPEALHALTADRAAISRVEYITNSEEVHHSTEVEQITVNCPTGLKVIGGGVTTTGAGGSRDFETRFSGPQGESTWQVVYNPDSDDRGETVRATAICATVATTSHQAD